MKKVCVVGCFGGSKELSDGQTVKTKIVYHEFTRSFGDKAIMKIDTYGGYKTLIKAPVIVLKALINAKNIVILPAENGLRVLAPLFVFFNAFFKRQIFYDVVGGWLPDFVQQRKALKKILKKMNAIYVETISMKNKLVKQGFNNVEVIPNCKELEIVTESELHLSHNDRIKLCTFSRVMKEKGIEDAVIAVNNLNKKTQGEKYELDIYGQIDSEQKEWFDELSQSFTKHIKYLGVVPFNKSTEYLKTYDALLFPTFYIGEGFAGTIIDAYAAGLPVIASDWKYNSEIVENQKTGLIFEVHNIRELEKCIISIRDGVDRWNEMKNNCIYKASTYLPCNAMKPIIDKIK